MFGAHESPARIYVELSPQHPQTHHTELQFSTEYSKIDKSTNLMTRFSLNLTSSFADAMWLISRQKQPRCEDRRGGGLCSAVELWWCGKWCSGDGLNAKLCTSPKNRRLLWAQKGIFFLKWYKKWSLSADFFKSWFFRIQMNIQLVFQLIYSARN